MALDGRSSSLLSSMVRKYEESGVVAGSPLTQRHLEEFTGRVPELLMELWKHFGFAGFDQGRFWLTDPLVWQDAADAWTARLGPAGSDDTWIPLRRSAFGHLEVWSPRTGDSVDIVALRGLMHPAAFGLPMESASDGNRSIYGLLSDIDRVNFDLYDPDERHLFAPCVASLGEVSVDTMYTFAPAPPLGGQTVVEHAVVAEAVPHLILLAELGMGD